MGGIYQLMYASLFHVCTKMYNYSAHSVHLSKSGVGLEEGAWSPSAHHILYYNLYQKVV